SSCSKLSCDSRDASGKLDRGSPLGSALMLDPRETERRNPRTASIDLASPLEIVDMINAEDRRVPDAVATQREQIARAIELAEATFRSGGRLFYVGAGTSGRLGVLDASECPPTFGVKPEMVQGIIAGGLPALTRSQEGAEDVVGNGARAIDEHGVGKKDFVIGIAASGTTPYVRAALVRAAELGARTGILACSPPPADLVARVDVTMLPIVGPEAVTGSTRMKAGTATKLVLNTITTGAMIRLGKTYGNLMVDLRATNNKLIDRSQRIVMEVCGVSRDDAKKLLEQADKSVKTAIVMQKRGVSLEEAKRLLAENGGVIRRITKDEPPPIREG
ncbi:MAG: N-acetylmuramic acid 6-phosphate etherase, partial [Gemmatimonadales bacterium]|nr:N-acetylmuramic acid 6-phosphate etherase [Gemmatimonadales bacterium]